MRIGPLLAFVLFLWYNDNGKQEFSGEEEMNRFFDILLYIDFFVAIPFFIIEIICFPAWVEQIDITKNKKGKPIKRYLENKYVLLELRIALTVILFAAVSIVSLLFSSFPREIENPGALISLPILILLLGTGFGGFFLGNYFHKTAKRMEIYQQAAAVHEIYVRNRAQMGMGVLICFYLSIVVAFPVMHLFFLLNLI